jgi:glycosyltransferase involved in cell wall biosynthesis
VTNEASTLKRVLMIFSNSYDGAYPRDLSHGFFDASVELGFISLSNATVPNWLQNHSAREFSKGFGKDTSLIRKVLLTISVIRSFKPDIIQTHLFVGGIVGLLAGKLMGIPVIHTRHHIDEHYQAGTFLHRWIDRIAAKKSDHVVVCSVAAKNWLIKVEGVKEKHITVINQGFDFSYLSPSTQEIEKVKLDLGFSENSLDIICVARYSKAKGQNYLLLALRDLIKTNPNITLTFMGPGDSEWLSRLVNELGLERYVRILSSRNDVPACIAAADMVIHPSLADSFSQLVIEAQAAGGLLLASDIAAVREQILNGKTGAIFAPRDPNSIVESARYLIDNPDIAISMRKNAPYHVRENFTWQRMVNEEIACLKRFTKRLS